MLRIRLPGPHAPFWVFAESLGAALFSFVSMMAIGRVIGPHEAGLGTVAIAAFLLLEVLGGTLFSDALVQWPALSKRHAESAATAAVLSGLILGLGLALTGPFLADSTDAPVVTWLVLTLAPLLPLTAFAGTASGLLLRERRFRVLALRLLLGQPLALTTGLLLASMGCGAWAMIGSQAVATGVTFLLMLRGSGLRLRLRPDLAALRDLWPVAAPQVAGIAVLAGRYRLFLIGLGLLVPQSVLAVSHFAFRLLDAASAVVWHATGRLAMPRLCALQGDRSGIAQAYGEIAQLQALIGLPIAGGLALVAPDLVQVLLGSDWAGTGRAAQVAGAAAMASFLYGDQISLFVAVGRARLNFYVACGMLVAPLLALIALRPATPEGAALVWGAPNVLAAPILAWMVLSVLRRSPWWLAQKLLPALGATVVMAVTVLTIQAMLAEPAMRLVGSILAGGLAFTAAAWLMLGGRMPGALSHAASVGPA